MLGEHRVEGVEDHAWLLGGRRAVEVDERPAAELAPEDRKLLGDALDVERGSSELSRLHAYAAASTSSRIQP